MNPDLTRKVAKLARLELTEEEIGEFTEQLQKILDHIESLKEIDVSGVEPLMHPLELETPLRDDEVQVPPRDRDGRPIVLKSAQETIYDGFRVPPVLGEDS